MDAATAVGVDLREMGEGDGGRDHQSGARRRDQRRRERDIAGQDPDRLCGTEDDEGAEADAAGHQEEDRRAADGEGGGDAGADQDHGAEGEAAAAAAGEEDVCRLLDHADIEGLAPVEPAGEGAAEGDDEAQHGEHLEDEGGDHPARLGIGEAVTDRLQERDPDHRGGGREGEAGGNRPVDEDRVGVGRLRPDRVGLLGAFAAPALLRIDAGIQFRLRGGLYELQHK
jgi:hypothetical protein